MLGASFDTPAENLVFADAQGFGFPLLSDVDRAIGTVYGVARQAEDNYAAYPERKSFLIDPAGTVRRVYEVSDVTSHARTVLDDLAELTGEP